MTFSRGSQLAVAALALVSKATAASGKRGLNYNDATLGKLLQGLLRNHMGLQLGLAL